MRILACTTLLLLLAQPALAAQAEVEPASEQVLATYARGKAAYDRGDHAAALGHFDQAAQADPTRARWQYNRGLALKKLGRDREAIEALLRSRALDPTYKVSEIDKKLADLGALPARPSPPSAGVASPESGDEDGSPGVAALFLAAAAGLVGLVGLVGYGIHRTRKRTPTIAPAALEPRLLALGARLTGLEHRFSQGEDSEARNLLEWATVQEKQARELLPKARLRPQHAAAVGLSIARGETAAAECELRLDDAFGPGAGGSGERVGCWFCAKPLATPATRVPFNLQLGGQATSAIVCPECAALAQAGRAPQVTLVASLGTLRHWSEVAEYDPYQHRHQPHPNAQSVALHKACGNLHLGAVGAAATGVLAAGAAVAAAQLLDLGALTEASAAEAAARASAAGSGRSDWADQS